MELQAEPRLRWVARYRLELRILKKRKVYLFRSIPKMPSPWLVVVWRFLSGANKSTDWDTTELINFAFL